MKPISGCTCRARRTGGSVWSILQASRPDKRTGCSQTRSKTGLRSSRLTLSMTQHWLKPDGCCGTRGAARSSRSARKGWSMRWWRICARLGSCPPRSSHRSLPRSIRFSASPDPALRSTARRLQPQKRTGSRSSILTQPAPLTWQNGTRRWSRRCRRCFRHFPPGAMSLSPPRADPTLQPAPSSRRSAAPEVPRPRSMTGSAQVLAGWLPISAQGPGCRAR